MHSQGKQLCVQLYWEHLHVQCRSIHGAREVIGACYYSNTTEACVAIETTLHLCDIHTQKVLCSLQIFFFTPLIFFFLKNKYQFALEKNRF